MKLAEALQERADLRRKIDMLADRLANNSLVQEGDVPAEDPAGLSDDCSRVDEPTQVVYWSDSSRRHARVCRMDTVGHVESVASITYKLSRARGGAIPYTVIRELAENFIHARFDGALVLVSPDGNGIGFLDKGNGLSEGIDPHRTRASTADELTRKYIRGVGAGFAIVRDWADSDGGRDFWYDENMKHGFAAFIASSENGRRVCQSIQAVAIVLDELDVGYDDIFSNGGYRRAAFEGIVYELSRCTRLADNEISRILDDDINRTNREGDRLADLYIARAEELLGEDGLYREALTNASERIASSCQAIALHSSAA